MLSKIKRPLMAMTLLMGLGMGVAMADDCAPAMPPVRPTSATTDCPPMAPVAPIKYSASQPDAAPSQYPVMPTAASMNAPISDIPYIVPSIFGSIETSVVPPADNEVERWYANQGGIASGLQELMY